MVIKQTRKTPQQIEEKILSLLKKGPLSTKKLSDLLKSNWSTINSYLEELKQDGKVREIYSRENLKVYVRSDYPVFYGLPLEDKKFNDSLFLLSRIIEKWQEEKKEIINKTTMQKIAVNVIKNNSFDIPVIRFHYGKVLTTFLEPERYRETVTIYEVEKPSISDKIIKAIEYEIKNGGHSNIAWKEKKKQYEEYPDMKIFCLSDKILHSISKSEMDPKNILDLFYDLFLEIPTGGRYSYLFKQYHEFIEAVSFIFNSKGFNSSNEDKKNCVKEILDTFNSLWQALTTEFFFEDIEPIINGEFKEIVQFIKDSKVKTYYFEIEEKLNNLLEYKKSLGQIKGKIGEDEKKIIEILLEGVNEE